MATYLFTYRHPSASEVWVTGNFNEWSKREKLLKCDGFFSKDVYIRNPKEKIHYMLVVDGDWTTDSSAPLENIDGSWVNVVLPEWIVKGPLYATGINSSLPPSSIATGVEEGKPHQASYKYRNFVDDHEIRIITLHYSSQFSDIVCNMEHVSLINPGSYIALSYCWGDSRTKKAIWVDDSCMYVTDNLYSALRHVRNFKSTSGDGQSVRLWVDAICINQEDRKERSMQIRIMRHIYSKAQEVISCIRDPFFGKIHPVHFSAEFVADLIRRRFVSNTESIKNKEGAWAALDRFFSLPYWMRVWVIQEIAVAPSVTILYGNIPILWDDVAATLALWKSNPVLLHRPGYSNALHLVEFRTRFRIARQPICLSDALYWSYKTQATDPRDKVFALLGLCHDGNTFVPLPNYEQSFEEIVFEMSRNIMAWDRTLDFICIKGVDAAKEDTFNPTWVPNWPNIWSSTLTVLESRILEKRKTYDFNPILEGPTQHSIKVQGIFRGKVEALSSVMSPHNKDKTPQPARAPWILSTSSLRTQDIRLQKGNSNDFETRDAISKALTMDLLPPQFSVSSARSCLSTLWTPEGRGAIHNLALIEWIDANAWFKVGKWTLREWSQLELGKISTTHKIAELELYLQTLERVLGSGMRLMVLENGKIGTAHPSVDISDSIYWIRGCSKPVALRAEELPDGSRVYRVIGSVRLQFPHQSGEFGAYRNFLTGKVIDRNTLAQFSGPLAANVEDLILV